MKDVDNYKHLYKCYADVERNGDKWTVTIGNGNLENCKEMIERLKEKYKKTDIKVNRTWIENINTINIIKSFCIQLINQYDLHIKVVKDKQEKEIFKIEDLQNHNYANIEDGEFHNLSDVIEGLDIYHDDYIFDSLEKRSKQGEDIKNDDWDLIASRFLKSEKVYKILKQIYSHNFGELITDDVSKELKKILDEDEFPLLYCYIEKVQELLNIIPYDTLKEYENSLHLYFETNDIERKDCELYSKSDVEFNSNIIKLAENVIQFDDFLDNENIEKSENLEL